ncbi:hypothetical protein KRP22_012312 [Phytophthora ramorum]|nr:hypothetical protein KRP22_15016 [Phytophthora ramorum]
MPPLTATSNPLEPVTPSPSCVKESGHCVRDAWIEKVVAAQEHQAATSSSYPSKQHLRSSESKSDSNDDVGGEHDYGEELQKYMAEATANLEKPLEDSDDSDEDSSDEDTDSESPRSDDIVDFDDMDDYVYSTMNTEGDLVGTVLYPASPEVCCANCTANPDCQFFVTDDGGWRHIEPKCRLVSKAQTMYDYLHGSAGKNTVVISGREIPAWGNY